MRRGLTLRVAVGWTSVQTSRALCGEVGPARAESLLAGAAGSPPGLAGATPLGIAREPAEEVIFLPTHGRGSLGTQS